MHEPPRYASREQRTQRPRSVAVAVAHSGRGLHLTARWASCRLMGREVSPYTAGMSYMTQVTASLWRWTSQSQMPCVAPPRSRPCMLEERPALPLRQ